ncbi:MAG: TSUP family transporter [Propionibacteriaceae bacterium]|jgi:uncharacterized membrane protein YfcA|nr:TSUP family transporter [Propionibacteriaceae bacterium]
MVPAVTVVLLCVAALAAGWVDAVVGGGGVIQLPALLVGLPNTDIASISGTNKMSSCAGTAVATGTYLSKIAVHVPTAVIVVVCAYLGSTGGAHLVQYVPRVVFTPLVGVAVAVIGVYVWRTRTLGQETHLRLSTAKHRLSAGVIGLVCGVWDGLVGPGTGIFLVLGFVVILGYGFLPATALAKVANLTTNIAALVVLGIQGHVLWGLGACMAAANVVGGAIGSRMAIAKGNSFIRKVFLVAVGLVEIKLVYDTIRLILG